MLLKMLQLIGKHVVEDKSRIQVLVDEQKEYKSDQIIIISINPNSPDLKDLNIRIEDYDNEKRYEYLRGTVGAGGSNFSPTMNISLQKLKNEEVSNDVVNTKTRDFDFWKEYFKGEGKGIYKNVTSALNFSQNITNSLKKAPLKNRDDNSIEKMTFMWIERNLDDLTIKVFDYLFDRYISLDDKIIKTDNKSPNTIIFEIKYNNKWYLPGALEEFVKLYLELVDDKLDDLAFSSSCFTCNNQTLKRLQPGIGIFNLDMQGFVQGLVDQKYSVQFSVCSECNQYIKSGFDYAETYLKFYAYRTNKGVFDKDGAYINHYFIPVITDPTLLKSSIDKIRETREEFSKKVKYDKTKEIESLSNDIKRAESKRKRDLKKRKKDLEKELQKTDLQLSSKMDTLELLIQLIDIPINYYDIYYYETDLKQNPSTKEVIGFYQISKSSIVKISQALHDELDRHFSLYSIRNVCDDKLFLTIMKGLFELKTIDSSKLINSAQEILKEAFQNKVLGKQTSYYESLSFLNRKFKETYTLLYHVGII